MRKHLRILGLVLVLVFHALAALAQSGSFTLDNAAHITIDRDAVEAAARTLMDKYGADVAIYAVATGSASDFTRRLAADGLAITATITNPRTLAIYIAVEEQYSEIRWGSRFDNLDGDSLRTGSLNPALRDRDFTTAFVAALTAAGSQMSNPFAGLGRVLGTLLSSPVFWVIVAVLIYAYFAHKFGWSAGNRRSRYTSGSRSSGSSGGRRSGGSSGGSWND